MIVRRSMAGFSLLVWLGLQYWAITWLRRVWNRPARAWRQRLDAHGGLLLAAYFRRHRGLLIKIGQFVASRPDVFPLPYVDACAPLRDQAPARPLSEVTGVLEDAYEHRIEAHLARIEEMPLAAASFGQVHRAWLADGRLVAVKIQYPDLAPLVAADLWLVRVACRLFMLLLPGWPLDQVYRSIERTSRDEMDYLHEGSAADRLRGGLAGKGLSVPEVLWEHTREKVLVMEFAPGITFAQLDIAALGTAERQRLAGIIIDGFLFMLIDEGFFHADPHAGNFIYDAPSKRLFLIDFGMTAEITRQESELYRQFLEALRRNDTDGMVDVLVNLGWVLPSADRAHLRALAREVYDSLAHLNPKTFKGSRREVELGAKITEFLRRMDGIVFPQHTVLLSRSTGLIEGVCMELVPDKNMLDLVRPRLKRLTSVRMLATRFWQDVQDTWRALKDLPDRLEAASSKTAPASTLPVVAGLIFIAALMTEPGSARLIATVAAGIAVIVGLAKAR